MARDEIPLNPYAFAATLAMDRMRTGKHEHMAFIGEDVEKAQELWGQTATALQAMVVDSFAESQLLEGEPISEEDKRHLSFAVGFLFGRAFEELQVLRLDAAGDLAVGG